MITAPIDEEHLRGHCFRFVFDAREGEYPTPCPETVVMRGKWRDRHGKVRWVEACADHAVDLIAAA